MALTHVLTPLRIADVEIRNRVVRTAHMTNLSNDSGGVVNDSLIAYHMARARGGVGLSIIEIMGIRLMLTNLFRPLATGQKLTPEAFDNMVAEVKRRKRSVAEDELQDLERAR